MRDARAGDRYLLCSDGLSGVVSHETMASAMADPDPQATADRLIELALRSGGPDNITCIVADVVEDDGRTASLIDPVVDGAAGDNRGQREVDPRSAAGRAALADPPPPPPSSAMSSSAPHPRRRRPLRTALIALGTLVVLGAVAIGGYVFVMGHWFVGVQEDADGEPVAVFQGLHASIVGLDLYRVDSATTLVATDLTPAARNRVTAGITADDRDDADRILDALRGQQLPVCRTTPRTTSTTTTPTESTPSAGSEDPALTSPSAPTESSSTAPTGSTTTSPTRAGGSEVECREAD
jgi:hypothetical protein